MVGPVDPVLGDARGLQQLAPFWRGLGQVAEFAAGQVGAADDHQHPASKGVQAGVHPVGQGQRGARRRARAECGAHQLEHRGQRALVIEAAAQHPGPEGAVDQAVAVIVAQRRARDAVGRADPWIEQHHAAHARVQWRVHHGRRGAVAQAPQHDLAHAGHGHHQGIDRCLDIVFHVPERALDAFAVAHAAVIEAHGGDAVHGQAARQQRELAVAAGAVLRPAHHHQHGARARGCWQVHHAIQAVALAGEGHDPFFNVHDRVPATPSKWRPARLARS